MITYSQLSYFINSQPGFRPINMDESENSKDVDCDCGCIMLHYGKEVINLKKDFYCGYDIIASEDGEEQYLFDIDSINFIRLCDKSNVKTYKEAQELL